MTDATEHSLLEAVLAAPDDESPRLAYAAHLTGRGDPRGEFIRIDCEMERLLAADPRSDRTPRWRELDARRMELLGAHDREWLAPLEALGVSDPGDACLYRNGFVEHLTLADGEVLTQRAAELFAALPLLRDVSLGYGVSLDAAALAARPETVRLRSLSVSGGGLGLEALEDFLSVRLPKLENLEILGSEFGGAGVAVLARGTFPSLRKLGLDYCSLGPRGVEALAAAPFLPQLTELDLGSNKCGSEALERLLAVPGFAPSVLALGSNELGPEAFECLARWANGRALRELKAETNSAWSDGAAALAGSPHLTGLTLLDLSGNELEPEGAAALAKAGFGDLRTLILARNGVGDDGAAALARAALPALRALDLSGNFIRDAGLTAFAAATGLPGLAELNLNDNRIGSAGAAALSKAAFPLADLKLGENRIGPEGVEALVGSAFWPALAELDLQDNPLGEAGGRTLASATAGPALRHLRLSPKGLPREIRAALRERYGDVLSL